MTFPLIFGIFEDKKFFLAEIFENFPKSEKKKKLFFEIIWGFKEGHRAYRRYPLVSGQKNLIKKNFQK